MNIIKGDIVEVARQNAFGVNKSIIVHQVNCMRVANAGLALQIKKAWPAWHKAYLDRKPLLGSIAITSVEKIKKSGQSNVYVCDFYAQYSYGRAGVYTDSSAFQRCLENLMIDSLSSASNTTLFFPYKIGCGLGGGDWDVIGGMIERYFPDATIVAYNQ